MKAPTPATVIATVALFVALGGTSIAATQLARNSVGTPQLKDNAVISSKVKDGSLLARDFKAGELSRGAKGETGPRGETGPAGAKGAAGTDGVTQLKGARLGTGVDLAANGNATTILRLSDGGGSLTLTQTSRVAVQFTVGMYKLAGDSAKTSRMQCTVQVANAADPVEPIQLSVPVYEVLGLASPSTAVDGFLTASGSQVLGAGTHDPYIACVNYGIDGYTGTVKVYGAALDVTVAPA